MLGEGARGEEAVTLGLAYRCLPSAEDLDHEATALAARLAAGPVRSMGLSKQLLNATFETDLCRLPRPGGPGPGHGGGVGGDGRGHGRLLREASPRLPCRAMNGPTPTGPAGAAPRATR